MQTYPPICSRLHTHHKKISLSLGSFRNNLGPCLKSHSFRTPNMPLTMRPTGLGPGVYKDVPDYSIFCGEWCIGRIYETRTSPPICAGSGRCTRLASQARCEHQITSQRWTRPRSSSRRAGSGGRRGRGWRRWANEPYAMRLIAPPPLLRHGRSAVCAVRARL